MISSDELKEKFSKLSVLVVGDMFLDIDYIGGYSGYSREVEQLPIFRAERVKYSPGGGGNLAVCFATLAVKTTVAGYWGGVHDNNRFILLTCFNHYNINQEAIVNAGRTPSFGKAYLHNGTHISRIDIVSEQVNDIKSKDELISEIRRKIQNADFVACADYEEVQDYGVCSLEVIDAVRQNAKVKFATSRKNVKRFHGFDYLIQNEKEIRQIPHRPTLFGDLDIKKQAVITMGGHGAKSYSRSREVEVTSQKLTENIDPCGCGDVFYAIYASSVMAGYDTTTCLQLANAGARVVARKLFGTGQADVEEITKEWEYLYNLQN